jgi:hypothetical protein
MSLITANPDVKKAEPEGLPKFQSHTFKKRSVSDGGPDKKMVLDQKTKKLVKYDKPVRKKIEPRDPYVKKAQKTKEILEFIKTIARPEPATRYDRSLIGQRKKHPAVEGVRRGAYSGALGAALGALLARLASSNMKTVGIGATLGGGLGAGAGYISGRNDAESDNSRLLFLRRRLGINEPGEFEMVLQNPALTYDMIDPKAAMHKQASGASRLLGFLSQHPKLVTLLGGTTGGASGGFYGSQISPYFGYSDSQPARRLSGFAGGLTGAVLGAGMSNPATRKAWSKFLTGTGPEGLKTVFVLPGALAAGEVLPNAIAASTRYGEASNAQRDAARDQSKAMTAVADSMSSLSIPKALREFTANNSGTLKGVAGGLGAAGLAGLLRGSVRERTDEEIREGKSRTGMILRDILRYAAPAAIGGGVIGSLAKR